MKNLQPMMLSPDVTPKLLVFSKQRQQLPRSHGGSKVDVVVHLHDLGSAHWGIVGEQKTPIDWWNIPTYIWIMYGLSIYMTNYIYIYMDYTYIYIYGLYIYIYIYMDYTYIYIWIIHIYIYIYGLYIYIYIYIWILQMMCG